METPEQNQWAIATIAQNRYETKIEVPGHTVTGDEPLSIGGTNKGPSPGDFLRMSLASCTAITLRMYADRKGWPVNSISVRVFSSVEPGGKPVFKSDVTLDGKLDPDQVRRMLQIAKACPIHKLLSQPSHISTELHLSESQS